MLGGDEAEGLVQVVHGAVEGVHEAVAQVGVVRQIPPPAALVQAAPVACAPTRTACSAEGSSGGAVSAPRAKKRRMSQDRGRHRAASSAAWAAPAPGEPGVCKGRRIPGVLADLKAV